jgi:hypothetical protein
MKKFLKETSRDKVEDEKCLPYEKLLLLNLFCLWVWDVMGEKQRRPVGK